MVHTTTISRWRRLQGLYKRLKIGVRPATVTGYTFTCRVLRINIVYAAVLHDRTLSEKPDNILGPLGIIMCHYYAFTLHAAE